MSNQFLRNTRAVLTTSFSAGAPAAGITATAINEAGVTVTSGSATVDGVDTSKYTFPIPPQTALMRGTTTWTGTWSSVQQSVETFWEVVGQHLFTIAEARAFRPGTGGENLSDVATYPDALIAEARDRITDAFQLICGVSFFPRYERESFDGTSKTRLWLPRKRPIRLISVTVDGVALTSPELALIKLYPTGRLERTAAWGSAALGVVVEWERGYRYVPADLKRAALALAQYEAVSSEITDRMVTFANELGTVRLSTPGRNAPTGIPLVDATLSRYDERDVLVAVH